jgi:hypothetical protein
MVMKNAQRVAAWFLLAAACTACGSQLVKGESPFVSISSMTAHDRGLSVTFNIRNINDVALDIETLAITIRAQGTVLLQHTGRLDLSVDPNTTEDVVIDQPPDEAARPLLASLQSGATGSLAFSLDGRVHSAQDGDLPFRHEGYLFPVPGKPGQFRATSTRTREQR